MLERCFQGVQFVEYMAICSATEVQECFNKNNIVCYNQVNGKSYFDLVLIVYGVRFICL